MSEKKVHCFVSGIVQGVFFRSHTKQWAQSLNLKGWVKNLSDGRVEFIAQGEETKINELLKLVSKGPHQSKVDDVKINWLEPKNDLKEFEIIR